VGLAARVLLHGPVSDVLARVGRVFAVRGARWASFFARGARFFRSFARQTRFGMARAIPSDLSFSPWLFNRQTAQDSLLLPLLCLHIHAAMGDSFLPFDLNVILEQDDNKGFNPNNGNVRFFAYRRSLLSCFFASFTPSTTTACRLIHCLTLISMFV
jgi:hypothetical protein